MIFLKGDYIIYLIVLLALSLRVHNFSSASIWSDESITLEIIHKTLWGIIKTSLHDVNAPFYTFITKFWAAIFGYSLPAVRFFSVVCSTLTVFVVFKIADRNFGRIGAITSTLLLCFSNIHIYYSQEARCYALLSLLASISLYYFLELIREPKTITLILYSLFSVTAIYTHMFFGFELLVQGIILIIYFRANMVFVKRFLLSQTIIILIFMTWFVPTFIYKSKVDVSSSWLPPLTWDMVMEYFSHVLNAVNLIYYFAIFYLLVSIWSAIKVRGNGDKKIISWSMILIFTVPFLLMCIVSLAVMPIFYSRFALFCSLPLFLSMGCGLSILSKQKYLHILMIALLIYMGTNVRIDAFRNQEWDKACAMELAFITDSDSCCFVVSPYYSEFCYIYYNMSWAYKEEYNNLYYFKPLKNLINIDDSVTFVQRKVTKYKRVIYYDSNPGYDDRIPVYLKNHYDSVYARKFYGIDFYVFDRRIQKTDLVKQIDTLLLSEGNNRKNQTK